MKSGVIKFGWRLLWGRLTGKAYPFLVQFSVTNRCNSRCKYCYAIYYARPSDDLSLDQIKTIIDELARQGIFRLNLVGGEPLLREDIGEIIEYARQQTIHCAMTTNGILVPKKIHAVKHLDTICFSLDGEPKGNDLNRGADAFNKVISGMDACKEAGIPMQLSAVLTKHTVHNVDFMVALAEQYDCKVGFTPLISQHRENCKHEHDLFPKNEDVKNALQRIVELKEKGKPVLFSAESYKYALRWPDYTRDIIIGSKPDFRIIPCYAGIYFCLIDYNGDIYPCPQLVGIFTPGNILRDGFSEAFNKASTHNCQACSMPCSTEFNLFFGLTPQVLWEQICNQRD